MKAIISNFTQPYCSKINKIQRSKVFVEEMKGSASHLNKLVSKDSPHILKLSGTYLFPRSRHQYIYQLSKNPARAVSATTRCSQPLVAISNEWLLTRLGAGVFESWYMY